MWAARLSAGLRVRYESTDAAFIPGTAASERGRVGIPFVGSAKRRGAMETHDRPAAGTAFGLDAFSLDDRMRLFTYVTVDNRTAYLWLLRAFDRERYPAVDP